MGMMRRSLLASGAGLALVPRPGRAQEQVIRLGVLTDLAGLALLVPPVRRAAAGVVRRRVRGAIDRGFASGAINVVDFGRHEAGAYEVIDAEDIPRRP